MNGVTSSSTKFACQSCGAFAPAWAGKCTKCGEWNTIIESANIVPRRLRVSKEEEVEEGEPRRRRGSPERAPIVPSSEIEEEDYERISTVSDELDRVLGGGLVAGGIVLLTGDPGAGKSTLLGQTAGALARGEERALYVSGEESLGQVGARLKRLGVEEPNVFVLCTKDLDEVHDAIDSLEPSVLFLDSVQTMRASELDSAAGTVSQLKEVAAQVIDVCKDRNIAAFLVGHVTKDGAVAGPKVLEHLVDTVLSFEGDKNHALRILRASKNRFGSENEIGVFQMTEKGMCEVSSPSALLLAERWQDAPGSAIAGVCEGSRSMLVEVQALVSERGSGRVTVQGAESGRLAMILAVLREMIGGTSDVFVNLAGGVHVSEPGLDLALAVAILSAALKKPVRDGVAVFGEIGLNGEVRGVARSDLRITEAMSLGFEKVICPASVPAKGRGLVKIKSVREGVLAALGCKESDLRAPKNASMSARARTRRSAS